MKSLEEIQEGLSFLEQLFSRYNDWTTDRVEGQPIEICRFGNTDVGEKEIVVIRRYPTTWSEGEALRHAKRDFQTGWLRQALDIDKPTATSTKTGDEE